MLTTMLYTQKRNSTGIYKYSGVEEVLFVHAEVYCEENYMGVVLSR